MGASVSRVLTGLGLWAKKETRILILGLVRFTEDSYVEVGLTITGQCWKDYSFVQIEGTATL